MSNVLLQRREKVLEKGSRSLFYEEPVHLVRGEGVWVYDDAGERYLDAYNNVPQVGHCHPHVVKALADQAATLNTHTRYLDENIVRYAERLTGLHDDGLSVANFVCTGTEANDVALQAAQNFTGAKGVICTDHAYHGNSAAVVEITTVFGDADKRGPNVKTIKIPDLYRAEPKLGEPEIIDMHVGQVRDAIEMLEEEGAGFAGLIVDTVFASEGLPVIPADYIRKVVDCVHDAGGLYIADEVQPGFGRMGDHFWGYQHYGVTPDIVTMGKPMGNGHPLAGVIYRREIAQKFHGDVVCFNTFGGNPVSCAVGMAVLDVLEGEGLIENARVTGEYLLKSFDELKRNHDLIGDVRGRGLYFAVELVQDRQTKAPATQQTRQVVNGMRDRHILISTSGRYSNALKIRPPLLFSNEHADLFVDTLDEVLAAVR